MFKKKNSPKATSNIVVRSSERLGVKFGAAHLIAFVLVFVLLGGYSLYRTFAASPTGVYGAYPAEIAINVVGAPSGYTPTFASETEPLGNCNPNNNVGTLTAVSPCYAYQFGASGSPSQLILSSAVPSGYSASWNSFSQNMPVGNATGLTNTASCIASICSFDFSSGAVTATLTFTKTSTTTTTTTPSSGSGPSTSCPYGSGVYGCYTGQVLFNVSAPGLSSVTLASTNYSFGNCPSTSSSGPGSFSVSVGQVSQCDAYQFGTLAANGYVGIQFAGGVPAGYSLSNWYISSSNAIDTKGPAAFECSMVGLNGSPGCEFNFNTGSVTVNIILTKNTTATTPAAPAPTTTSTTTTTTTPSSGSGPSTSCPYGSGVYGCYTSEVVIKTTGLPAGTPVTFYGSTPNESIGNCLTQASLTVIGSGSITCSGYQFGASSSPADLGIQTMPQGYTLGSATPASQSLPAGSATGLTNTATCPSGGALGCNFSFSKGVATVTFNFVVLSQSFEGSPGPIGGNTGSGSSSSCAYGSGKDGCYTSQVIINVQGVSTATLKSPNESIGNCGQTINVTGSGSVTCSGYQFGANSAGGGGAQLDLDGGVPNGYTLSSWSVSPLNYAPGPASGLTNGAVCSGTGCSFDFSKGQSTVTLVFRPSSDTLYAGEDLPTGGSMYSANGPFGESRATVQGAGNLVVADAGNKVLWADKCGAEGNNDYLAMQTDGNLVLYDSNNDPLWATNTSEGAGANDTFAHAQIQNDGNFVMVNNSTFWTSKSASNCAIPNSGGGNSGPSVPLADTDNGKFNSCGQNQPNRAQQILCLANILNTMGIPYVSGGTSLSGFDCSGLTQWLYGEVGIAIPRIAGPQFYSDSNKVFTGSPDTGQLQIGDLLYYNYDNPGPNVSSSYEGDPSNEHVVMYIGNGQVIAAPHTGTVVQIQGIFYGDLQGVAWYPPLGGY